MINFNLYRDIYFLNLGLCVEAAVALIQPQLCSCTDRHLIFVIIVI